MRLLIQSVFITGPLNCGCYLQHKLWGWKKNHQMKFRGFCQAGGQTKWSDWCFLCTNLFLLFACEHLGGNCQHVLMRNSQCVLMSVAWILQRLLMPCYTLLSVGLLMQCILGWSHKICALGCIWTSHLQVKMDSYFGKCHSQQKSTAEENALLVLVQSVFGFLQAWQDLLWLLGRHSSCCSSADGLEPKQMSVPRFSKNCFAFSFCVHRKEKTS